VDRIPTITVHTDASTKALGGWSAKGELDHMWRITMEDLLAAGLASPINSSNVHNFHEPQWDPRSLHINILEFLAIFIELWICVIQLHVAWIASRTNPPTPPSALAEVIPQGGHRLLARADNTSALSWLRYASRTKRAPVRRLARLLTAFLSREFPSSHLRVQPNHIPGVANVPADHLSRFELSPSWGSAMANCPELKTLRTCQFPQELLSLLVSAFSKPQTGEWFETATTRLWTIAPPVFATGSARLAGTTTSVVCEP
jgi:hypothetical protein